MKKIIALILALLLGLTCFVACGDKEESEETEAVTTAETSDTEGEEEEGGDEVDLTPTKYTVTAATPGVKVLGERYLASENSLYVDHIGSGFEFAIDHKGGNIRFQFGVSAACLFRVWVDGQAYAKNNKAVFEVGTAGLLTLTDIAAGKHTIRVVKASSSDVAIAELKNVTFAGSILSDAIPAKDLYIEFIGDDVSCGVGVLNAENPNDTGYKSQDGTLAYPYLVAQALDADYSIFTLPGQKLVGQIESKYAYTSPARSTDEGAEYDFARKADVVVINVGTIDQASGVNEVTFQESYAALLATVREKHGEDVKILCLYNAYNETYADAILAACEEMGGVDLGIVTVELTRAAGGYATAAEHAAYAGVVKTAIENHEGVFVPTITVVPSGDGDEDYLDNATLA